MKRLKPTVKHGGHSVMVWGAIWSDGLLELMECHGSITCVKYAYIMPEGLIPIFPSGGMIKNESLFI